MAFSRQLQEPDSADEALARRARSESAAFEELYRRHVARVHRYHLVRTGNVSEAQDLTAQTFLAAFEGIAGYRGESTFVAWLVSIARHKVADYFRGRKPDLPIEAATNLPQRDQLPEDFAMAKVSVTTVRQCIEALTPDRAEALVLRFFAGLSAREAGQVMGRSEAAVKMLVHRGLRDLKKQLIILGQE
ncbi:MAG: RNA polymerase sigma factor [Anaerolineales bacterium]|nr:RNA polymerase sigma factor [Anaerolineales bacterium]